MTDILPVVLEEIEQRGLRLRLGDDGAPRLSGPKEQVTPGLIAVLRYHRRRVIERLGGDPAAPPPPPPAALAPEPPAESAPVRPPASEPLRQWLWRSGLVWTEERAAGEPPLEHPSNALWWRHAGEAAWRPIDGRVEPFCALPEERKES